MAFRTNQLSINFAHFPLGGLESLEKSMWVTTQAFIVAL